MNVNDDNLLRLAKTVVRGACPLLERAAASNKEIRSWEGREPKADIDAELSEYLIRELGSSSVPILSEEEASRIDWREAPMVWIVDPLDGTLNFIRGTGPSSVSVALWRKG